MIRLSIFREAKTRLPLKKINGLFTVIVEKESSKGWQGLVNLVFTDDRVIQRLNRVHRKKDKPTDVLSFSVDSPDSSDAVFGEIYISCTTAKRQASAYGGTLAEEYLRLVCHGLLHLFGYDHMKKPDAAIMQAKEQTYFRRV